MNKKYENYLKTMENLPKEIEDLLKKQGKEPTEFIIKNGILNMNLLIKK